MLHYQHASQLSGLPTCTILIYFPPSCPYVPHPTPMQLVGTEGPFATLLTPTLQHCREEAVFTRQQVRLQGMPCHLVRLHCHGRPVNLECVSKATLLQLTCPNPFLANRPPSTRPLTTWPARSRVDRGRLVRALVPVAFSGARVPVWTRRERFWPMWCCATCRWWPLTTSRRCVVGVC